MAFMISIEISKIPSGGLAFKEEIAAETWPILKQLIDDGECSFVTPILFDMRILPQRDLIIVKGRFETKVSLTCSRCLDTYAALLEKRFTLRYGREITQELHGDDAGNIEVTADQIGVSYFEGEEIVLDDALQEQVVMTLPFKCLCRDDCKGICQGCGADLNREACTCSASAEDTPFAVLKKLHLPTKK